MRIGSDAFEQLQYLVHLISFEVTLIALFVIHYDVLRAVSTTASESARLLGWAAAGCPRRCTPRPSLSWELLQRRPTEITILYYIRNSTLGDALPRMMCQALNTTKAGVERGSAQRVMYRQQTRCVGLKLMPRSRQIRNSECVSVRYRSAIPARRCSTVCPHYASAGAQCCRGTAGQSSHICRSNKSPTLTDRAPPASRQNTRKCPTRSANPTKVHCGHCGSQGAWRAGSRGCPWSPPCSRGATGRGSTHSSSNW